MLATRAFIVHSGHMTVRILGAAPLKEQSLSSKLNWLRAGVLGANDGIVSTAGLVFGVAGATADPQALLIAGLAGLVAGALSMAGGEYVSVSSQRDTELAALAQQRQDASDDPAYVRTQLRQYYIDQGLPPELAEQVAIEMGDDALDHHALTSLGIDAGETVSPWSAARASMFAFIAGAVIPLFTMVLTPTAIRLPCTLVAVWLALLLTGLASARLGDAAPWRPMLRNLIVGTLTMGLTYGVGMVVGTQLA